MTSSPELPTDLRIGYYRPGDNAEALALEARCAQGRKYRLRFERPYFHRRAENFDYWRIVTARAGGELVGLCAGAIKPVKFEGRDTSALFLFDARVDPTFRRTGIGRELVEALIEWAAPHAEIGYAYAVGDNEAVTQLGHRWIGAPATPSYAYLVYPLYKKVRSSPCVTRSTPEEVHVRYLESVFAPQLYSDPSPVFGAEALVGSWTFGSGGERAGCSVWSNENILAEVVESLPGSLELAGRLLSSWPAKLLRTPHIPHNGERLKSWYVFDFHASNRAGAESLMDALTAEGLRRGIDYCYIIHAPGDPVVRALRNRVPPFFAPIIPYSIMARTIAGRPLCIERPYIDMRDV